MAYVAGTIDDYSGGTNGSHLKGENRMSHPAQLEFIEITKSIFPEMFVGLKVLEIGSLDINGSVRSFFDNCDYTRLDIAPGRGVDVVCEGQKYDAPSASFDVVLSCEVRSTIPSGKIL